MKTPKTAVFSLAAGEPHMRAESPALFIIEGIEPYIWIGNDSAQSKGCFAIVSGRDRLRRIAKAILKVAGTTTRRAKEKR